MIACSPPVFYVEMLHYNFMFKHHRDTENSNSKTQVVKKKKKGGIGNGIVMVLINI